MKPDRTVMTPALAAALRNFRSARKKLLADESVEKERFASQQQLAHPKGGGKGARGGRK